MLHYVLLYGILYSCWLIFSGYTTPFFLISGAVSSLLAVGIIYRMDALDGEKFELRVNWNAPVYLLWIMKEIAISSFHVTKQVWQPRITLYPRLGWILIHQHNAVGVTIYANSITLTPGTVSVLTREKHILVHALEESSIDVLREGEMDRRVCMIHRRVST